MNVSEILLAFSSTLNLIIIIIIIIITNNLMQLTIHMYIIIIILYVTNNLIQQLTIYIYINIKHDIYTIHLQVTTVHLS